MTILLILRNFSLSVMIAFVCIFSAGYLYHRTLSCKNYFIEDIYWCLGTLIGLAPLYIIPMLNYFLTF